MDSRINQIEAKARVIAMYLPQYHPIDENNEIWGKGYTEWLNVAKAKPLFKGHYQPRIPTELGFYDLRVPEIRESQAELARKAGVEGFMYWHYWFGNGKRLLERPFNEVLASGKPDFPFCLGWANHSWKTSTWTATKNFSKNSIIVEQKYPGIEDYIAHFNCVLPAFLDSRYIKVEGKPIFVIYEPLSIPDTMKFIELWQKLAREHGLPGIHFVGLSSGWLENNQPILDAGFDAIAPGNLWHAESQVKGKYKKLLIHKIRQYFNQVPLDKYEYKEIINYLVTEIDYSESSYPCMIPQWDRSPRSGRNAVIWHGSTPELFEKHVKDVLKAVENKPYEKKIVFLRSWNEWGEGNYIEPDLKFGNAYLETLFDCLKKD
jgi:hypothetical protein